MAVGKSQKAKKPANQLARKTDSPIARQMVSAPQSPHQSGRPDARRGIRGAALLREGISAPLPSGARLADSKRLSALQTRLGLGVGVFALRKQ